MATGLKRSRLRKHGQVTIPMEIRRRLGLVEGDMVTFIETEAGIVLAAPGESEVREAERDVARAQWQDWVRQADALSERILAERNGCPLDIDGVIQAAHSDR